MVRFASLRGLVAPVVAALALSVFASESVAKDRPFFISGGGIAIEGLPLPGQPARTHWSVGTATHLGLYFGLGKVQTDSAVPDFANGIITGEFGSGSPYVFTSANGSKLETWYGRTDHGADVPGQFQLTILEILPDGNLVVEAEFLAEFVIDPATSTGKFAGATGSWTMYAFTEPFVLGSMDPIAYGWVGAGTINY